MHVLHAKLNHLLSLDPQLRSLVQKGQSIASVGQIADRSVRVALANLRDALRRFLLCQPQGREAQALVDPAALYAWMIEQPVDVNVPSEVDVLRVRHLVRFWVSYEADREDITARMLRMKDALAKFKPDHPIRIYRNERKQGEAGWKEQYDFATAWSTDIYDAKVFGDVDRRLVTAVAQPGDILVYIPMVEAWAKVYELGKVDVECQDEAVVGPHPSFEKDRQEIPDDVELAEIREGLREPVLEALKEEVGEEALAPNALAEVTKVIETMDEPTLLKLEEQVGKTAAPIEVPLHDVLAIARVAVVHLIQGHNDPQESLAGRIADVDLSRYPWSDRLRWSGGLQLRLVVTSTVPETHPCVVDAWCTTHPSRVCVKVTDVSVGQMQDVLNVLRDGTTHAARGLVSNTDAVFLAGSLRSSLAHELSHVVQGVHEGLQHFQDNSNNRGERIPINHPLELKALAAEMCHGYSSLLETDPDMTVEEYLHDDWRWNNIVSRTTEHERHRILTDLGFVSERARSVGRKQHPDMLRGSRVSARTAISKAKLPDLQTLIDEFAPILDPENQYPKPQKVSYVNRANVDWLGINYLKGTLYATATNVVLGAVTETLIQRGLGVDLNHLRKVVAHELCHHYEWCLVTTGKSKEDASVAIQKHKENNHSTDWMVFVDRINAVYGPDFVTKTSDLSQLGYEGRSVYVAVVQIAGRKYPRFMWDHTVPDWLVDDLKEVRGDGDTGHRVFIFKTNDRNLIQPHFKAAKGAWNPPQTQAELDALENLITNGQNLFAEMASGTGKAKVRTTPGWTLVMVKQQRGWINGWVSNRPLTTQDKTLLGQWVELEQGNRELRIAKVPGNEQLGSLKKALGKFSVDEVVYRPGVPATIDTNADWCQELLHRFWAQGEVPKAAKVSKFLWPKTADLKQDLQKIRPILREWVAGGWDDGSQLMRLLEKHKDVLAQFRLKKPVRLWRNERIKPGKDDGWDHMSAGFEDQYTRPTAWSTDRRSAESYASGPGRRLVTAIVPPEDTYCYLPAVDEAARQLGFKTFDPYKQDEVIVRPNPSFLASRRTPTKFTREEEQQIREDLRQTLLMFYEPQIQKMQADRPGSANSIRQDALAKIKAMADGIPTEELPERVEEWKGKIKEWSKVSKFLQPKEAKVVFHGTPHDFEEFKLEHLGSGEGGQSYGWGLYFTDTHVVADGYRKALSVGNNPQMERDIDPALFHAAKSFMDHGTIPTVEELQQAYPSAPIAHIRYVVNQATGRNMGRVFEVEIPDGPYLLWDAGFREQSPEVRKALKNAPGEMLQESLQPFENTRGEGLYFAAMRDQGSKEAASKLFRSLGIKGIQYLDGNSRDAGEGSYNYVIFDDKDVKVLKKSKFLQPKTASSKLRIGQDVVRSRGAIGALHRYGLTTRRILEAIAQDPYAAVAYADNIQRGRWSGSLASIAERQIAREIVNKGPDRIRCCGYYHRWVQPGTGTYDSMNAWAKSLASSTSGDAKTADRTVETKEWSKVSKVSALNPTVGFNVNDSQRPWTQLILSGQKTIETRDSDSLRPHVGEVVGIVRTGVGPATLVATCTLGEPKVYRTNAEFRQDNAQHQIPNGPEWDIQPGAVKYGYPLEGVQPVEEARIESQGRVWRRLATADDDWHLYLDSDGVIADYEAGADAAGIPYDDFSKVPGSYRHLPVLPGAAEAIATLQNMAPGRLRILSKPSTSRFKESCIEKREWYRENFPSIPPSHILLVLDKGAVVGKNDIAVDDHPEWSNLDKSPGTVITFTGPETWEKVFRLVSQRLTA